MRPIRGLLVTASFAFLACGAHAEQRPAVVELFTSEGCSSCPPAEAYLGELARRPDVLALAFHVDYWDNLGWADRFGIPEATPRQQRYGQSLDLATVYTPQVVIDGKAEFVGNDRVKIAKSLEAKRDGLPIAIEVRGETISIDVSGQSGSAPNDILFVAYRRSAVSAIGRGENSGRTLTEYNMVRAVRHLGSYAGGVQSYRVEVGSLPSDATDIAVLVQSPRQGPIVGAASRGLR